jgi:hypothetical protein
MTHPNPSSCFIRAYKHRAQDADASPYINHTLVLACVLAEEGGVTARSTQAIKLRNYPVKAK